MSPEIEAAQSGLERQASAGIEELQQTAVALARPFIQTAEDADRYGASYLDNLYNRQLTGSFPFLDASRESLEMTYQLAAGRARKLVESMGHPATETAIAATVQQPAFHRVGLEVAFLALDASKHFWYGTNA